MDFKLILGILGNCIAIALFASPLPTFWRIFKKKDTENFSGIPYVATLMNCLLWVLYGLPMVSKDALLVLTINVAGCAFEISYLILFLLYSPKKERRKVSKILVVCTTLYAVLVALSLTVVPKKTRKTEVGSLCVVFGVGMYVSPLSVMRLVIKTRSVQYMPLLLCVFVFLNSTIWTGYGILAKDVFIIIPNALGMLAGVLQLSLHVIYWNATPLQTDIEGAPGHGKGDPGTGVEIAPQTVYPQVDKDGRPVLSKSMDPPTPKSTLNGSVHGGA
ncbi:hypothetical protein R1sor_019627 [Riccia sorocarpa]|uniref:Bidirectional sugar transporter SWEET n=1 Tax=Riccia sorocarpa TaxID=122646 RepID=A0ABD3IGP2_9MARC